MCECGNTLVVSTSDLKSNNTKSCGCLKKEIAAINVKKLSDKNTKYNIIPGQKFGNLTIVEQAEKPKNLKKEDSGKHYLCKCICGNEKIIRLAHLISGTTISCGCFLKTLEGKLIQSKKNAKFHPQEALAKSIYESKYNDGNLTFKQYVVLSQLNCHYCDCLLQKTRINNSFKIENNKILSKFLCNGIDRINSNLPHNFDNSLPCCKFCNLAKRERSYKDFLLWADVLYLNYKKEKQIINVDINNINKYVLSSAKSIWQTTYKKEDKKEDIVLNVLDVLDNKETEELNEEEKGVKGTAKAPPPQNSKSSVPFSSLVFKSLLEEDALSNFDEEEFKKDEEEHGSATAIVNVFKKEAEIARQSALQEVEEDKKEVLNIYSSLLDAGVDSGTAKQLLTDKIKFEQIKPEDLEADDKQDLRIAVISQDLKNSGLNDFFASIPYTPEGALS